MYFDFDDRRPDVPRVPAGVSRGAGVVLSIVVHALGVLAVFVLPAAFQAQALLNPVVPPQETVRFVQMTPRVDRTERTPRPAESSDRDRRSKTPVKPLNPDNAAPYSRGNSSEKAEATPPPPPDPGDQSSVQAGGARATADLPVKVIPDAPTVSAGPSKNLGDSLRNLQRYLQDQNFNNLRGGASEQDPDIQFDAKGVEFGPWLRRFVAQVKGNWFVPQAAMARHGRVVITFYVLKNGSILDLQVIQPSAIEGYTTAAFNALRLSNPTMPLPPEYPSDRAFFTVTFRYNEGRP
ncbi:MAG TPA: TonB family protein [Vicinamibacterales bacterium]|jgi:TonB family protein